MNQNAPSAASRREFLKTAAGVAAAGAIGRQALGQDGAKPAEGAKPPAADAPKPQAKPKPPGVGEGLSIGLIGCGGQGSYDMQIAQGHGVKVVAVCDVDEGHLASAKKRWDGAETYTDFRKLLEQKNVDAVICGTPDHWHTLVSIAAMRAGKDVYCEKPLTLTIDEGQHLARVQRETKRILQTGTQQRSDFYFRTACELVRNNKIGKLKSAHVFVPAGQRGGPFKESEPPAGFDFDRWLGQTPKVPYVKERTHLTFRYWWEYSGGTITDWGAHHNDIVLWATGYERSGPVSVDASVLKEPVPGGFTVPSEWEIRFAYENGVTHTCTTTTANAWNGSVVDPKGQQHGIRFEGTDGWIWVTRGSFDGSDRAAMLKYKFGPEDQRLYHSTNHMGNFLECVKSRKETICPAEVGHRSASLCHLGAISMRLGRKLQWNPGKEEFVGDEEANRWRSREMRQPWDYSMVGGA
jgi:predicted dehydrogenase